ncbi:sensor domain-containing diguanylate cyclase [Lacticaseibacillus zhaodongensis]|uniref:sensor domain-containing diguanylate cyclase n=1 Tax=Lacticaseibacillus zhaodongensis TaxID=2668065 RepID=UPI0012D2DB20|nr:diguanylate cyclase [Lacticaseibacillus zhaodongensis]
MNMNMDAVPKSGSSTDPLSLAMWLAQMLITWMFATGFITYYQRAWHRAYEKYRRNRLVSYALRAGMLVIGIAVGIGMHMVGWMVFTDATGLMFHNLGLFVLTLTLLDKDSSIFEYLIRVVAVLEVWMMHHAGYYDRPQFWISLAALGLSVIIFRLFSDRIRNHVGPHILAYGFVGVAFWTMLPKYSAGLHMTPMIAIQALAMYMGMTIVTAIFLRNEHVEEKRIAAVAQEAHFDTLTNAKSYAVYRQDIESKFDEAQRNHTPLSLAVIDIDHFKQVNDHYGHLAGDEVLRGVSGTLEDVLQKSPYDLQLYRAGGEEFNVVLPGLTAQQSKPIMLACWKAIRTRHFKAAAEDVVATISIGVAELQDDDEKFDALYARADDSLYQSKHFGRDAITITGETIDVKKERRVYATSTLYTQHVMDVLQNPPLLVHNEILIADYDYGKDRWNFNERFVIPISTQLRFIHKVLAVSPCPNITISLSPRQFREPDTPQLIGAFMLKKKKLRRLVIGLHDLPEPAEMSRLMNEYRRFNVAIEYTVGKADAEINTVRLLAPYLDGIKFSLADLRRDYSDDVIVQRMQDWAGIAHSVDADLIVSGVENQHDVDFVKHELHVRYAQGYYFDRPELPRFS